MIPKSIRWRLPLSYAAIALLAALSLGIVLLTTLRGYYQQRELDYLTGNAIEFSVVTGHLLESGLPTATLQSHVEGFAFLAQARVRLLDTSDRMLADSGIPKRTDVTFGAVAFGPARPGEVIETPLGGQLPDVFTFISVGDERLPAGSASITGTRFITVAAGLPADAPVYIETAPRLSFVGTPLGFNLSAEVPAESVRSDQVVRQPFTDTAGNLLGYVELSEGPAYGREIVDSVARGSAIAGGVAIVLAAGVGWIISRRISLPLLALNEVTTRMAEGDLSTRADVTHRDEFGTLARSFNEMADQVESTVVALRRFVADAAHELHTPLTALRTDLELAGASDPNPAQPDLLDRAQTQVRRLETLTNSLLDLSRIEAGKAQPKHHAVNLVDLVREMSEGYASRAEQAGIVFSLDLPEASAIVQGDEDQLRRALGNLLDNAIKFTPEGGAVRVGLRRHEDSIELRVEDTGVGIPPNDLPQLFSRFHRGRNAAGYPGNGLGLAIVKAIVENYAGQVTAENTSRGARFSIRLPAADR